MGNSYNPCLCVPACLPNSLPADIGLARPAHCHGSRFLAIKLYLYSTGSVSWIEPPLIHCLINFFYFSLDVCYRQVIAPHLDYSMGSIPITFPVETSQHGEGRHNHCAHQTWAPCLLRPSPSGFGGPPRIQRINHYFY